ncbi:MAG: DUF86 domain-containing protein [Bacteroidales bacterium]|jgi:uncharacterized protein with HEPN domain|nr:DUF86 domain-containing protein [Bacteroidales bacterium]
MREPSRDKGRLEDIIEAGENIAQFIEGYDFDSFMADKLRYFATLKNVEIIGEAAYMLSAEFKQLHPELPWKEAIGMRHVLVHGYSSILPSMLWDTCVKDIPRLVEQVKGISNN